MLKGPAVGLIREVIEKSPWKDREKKGGARDAPVYTCNS